MDAAKKNLSAVIRVLHTVEDLFLGSILLTMVVFSFVQLILRNFMGTGINWGDSFLRQLVLWLGLIGAAVATRQDRHINIDLSTKFLPPRWAAATRVLTDAFSAVVCALVAYAGIALMKNDMASGAVAFASIPAWAMESAIPIGFGIISLRFARTFVIHLLQAIGKLPIEQEKAAPPSKAEE